MENQADYHHLKVLLLGDHGVGKSSLCHAIMKCEALSQENHYHRLSSIVNHKLYLEKAVFFNGSKVKIQFWNTQNMELYESLPDMFFHNVDLALLCFDTSSRDTFNNINKWVGVLDEKSKRDDVPIGLVPTKIDKKSEVEVFFQEICDAADSFAHFVQFVSASQNKGIAELIYLICKTVLYNEEGRAEATNENPNGIKLEFFAQQIAQNKNQCFSM